MEEMTVESGDGFDEDVVESIEASRRNREAEVAFPVEIAELTDDDRRVEVTFQLPHGDESFRETFAVDPDGHRTVDDLLATAGLDPEIDSIADLDGWSVPVTRRRGSWRVDLDDRPTADAARTGRGIDALGTLSVITSVVSVMALFPVIAGFATGSIGIIGFIPAVAALVGLRVASEGTFALAAAHDSTGSATDKYSRAWRNYLADGSPPAAEFLFHLLTGGRLLT